MKLEVGFSSFVETDTSARPHAVQAALLSLVREAGLAESLGASFFGIGEHHRPDFAVSAPDVVLAYLAASTSTIRLSSAVTVLAADDPARVLSRFNTLDILSGGRAELMVGKGAYREAFDLFGVDPADADRMFESKLRTLVDLLRTPLGDRVYPHTAVPVPLWLGVSGSATSMELAEELSLPAVIAVRSGDPARHAARSRRLPAVGLQASGYLAATDAEARESFWPHYLRTMKSVGGERNWGPPSKEAFDQEVGPQGALFVGSPRTVGHKVERAIHELGISRFVLKYGQHGFTRQERERNIELFLAAAHSADTFL